MITTYTQLLREATAQMGAYILIDDDDMVYLDKLAGKLIAAWDANQGVQELPHGPETALWPAYWLLHPALAWAESWQGHSPELYGVVNTYVVQNFGPVADFYGWALKWIVVQEAIWATGG